MVIAPDTYSLPPEGVSNGLKDQFLCVLIAVSMNPWKKKQAVKPVSISNFMMQFGIIFRDLTLYKIKTKFS